MRRRRFILGFAAGATLWPVAGVAQTAPRPLVACLVGSSKAMAERYFGGFLQGMRELGYVEGQNWTFESRYLDGDSSRGSACRRAVSSQA
jgi:putative ABC transport system substrate-binding protein